MARVPLLAVLPPVIFLGLGALFMWGMQREDPDALPTALAGRMAPEFDAQPLGELPLFTPADLADGEIKLVNFWASWCAPCRVEHPNLEKLAAEGLPIYGVNYKDKPDNAIGFLDELGNPYQAVAIDPNARIGLEWGVYGVPETFVIDGQGRVVYRFAGPLTERSVEGQLRPALARAAGATD